MSFSTLKMGSGGSLTPLKRCGYATAKKKCCVGVSEKLPNCSFFFEITFEYFFVVWCKFLRVCSILLKDLFIFLHVST